MAKKKNGPASGGNRSRTDNLFALNALNYSLEARPRKPYVIPHISSLEDVLPRTIAEDGEDTECPRCMALTMRMLSRIADGGYLIVDDDDFQRAMHDATGCDTLHVVPLRGGGIVRYQCRNCGMRGYHNRRQARGRR